MAQKRSNWGLSFSDDKPSGFSDEKLHQKCLRTDLGKIIRRCCFLNIQFSMFIGAERQKLGIPARPAGGDC